MFTLEDVEKIEGNAQTPEEYYASIQRAINSGAAWSLQGSFGRAMMDAITDGTCMLGTTRATDYWGNVFPARTDVQVGTKGSFDYVVERSGLEWAQQMEAV